MNEIRPLTGLRGIAALCVFLAHLRITLGDYGLPLGTPEWFSRLFLEGGRQVDVFFVLSGFILMMNYRSWFAGRLEAGKYFTFLRRRFARIYPLHFTVLLLVICFVVAAHVLGASTSHGLGRFDPAALPAHFLLMHAWGIFFEGPGEWNPPSWSVSIEALAYLFFPVVVYVLARRRDRDPLLPVGFAVCAGFALNAMTHWGLAGFAGIARGLCEFLLGCCLQGLVAHPVGRWLQGRTGSIAAFALIVVCYVSMPDTGFVIALCASPLLLSLTRENPASRFFGWTPIWFLGEISYSIYLGHFLFSSIAYRIVGIAWMKTGPWQTVAGILLISAFVVSLSAACFYAIERPGRRLLAGRRKAAAAP
jgi:peptidoglycan/LPS O-acetylase OafA/YrhL